MATWNTIGTGDGTLTSINTGYGLTGGPITTSGTIQSDLTVFPQRAFCRVVAVDNFVAIYNNGSSGVGATLTNDDTLVALSIDGVSLAVGDRVLVSAQDTTLENGIYTVTTVGSVSVAWVLTRTVDFDGSLSGGIARGVTVWVSEGTQYDQTVWMETGSGPFTVGTTPIVLKEYPNNIVDQTSPTRAMVNNKIYMNRYIDGLVTYTLPLTAKLGDTLEVVGNATDGWKIAQNANQKIEIDIYTTTVGTGGYISSTKRGDRVFLRCLASGTSTVYRAYPNGNITYV